MTRLTNPRLALVPGLGLLAALSLAACTSSSDGDDGDFQSKSVRTSVPPGTPLVVRGEWAVYLADEATTGDRGTDFNEDGDFIDSIAVALDLRRKEETVLDVAALDVLLVSDQVYVVVDEVRDSRDWNEDGDTTDVVLLHWSRDMRRIGFVDQLGPGPVRAVASSVRLYYTVRRASMGAETNLRYLRADDPRQPVPVLNETDDPRRVRLCGIEEELLVVFQDEEVEGTDLNGDGTDDDSFVVGLVDTTDPSAVLRNVGLAVEGFDTPYRARNTSIGDWVFAILVSERAHGDLTGGGFNDPIEFSPSWLPPQCIGDEDDDLDDHVLHYLFFRDFVQDPVANAPVNTGLVGTDRIVITDTDPPFVATISREADEGTCDLNGDGDLLDSIARWVEATTPVLPFTNENELLAVADLPGGGNGLGTLEFALFMAMSEEDQAEDIDGDGEMDSELVAWLDPERGNSAFWILDQDEGPEEVYVGTDWIGESADRLWLLTSLQEAVLGVPVNTGDTDTKDSVPAFGVFDEEEDDIDFLGENIAVARGNAGIVIAGGFAFYRVDEEDDDRDWNRDGDENDMVLFRTNLENGSSDLMGTLNNLDRPAIAVSPAEVGVFGGAFLANEAMAREDLNRDGDTNDWAVQFFRF